MRCVVVVPVLASLLSVAGLAACGGDAQQPSLEERTRAAVEQATRTGAAETKRVHAQAAAAAKDDADAAGRGQAGPASNTAPNAPARRPATGSTVAGTYVRALRAFCEPVDAAARSAKARIDTVGTARPTDQARIFSEAQLEFYSALGTGYDGIAALQEPAEFATFHDAVRRDLPAVRQFVATAREQLQSVIDGGTLGPEIQTPRTLIGGLPTALDAEAPACRKIFRISE